MNSKWLILVGTGALSFSAACSSDGTPSYGSAGASAQAGATSPSAGGAGASSAGAPPTAGAGGSVAGAAPTAGAAGSLVTAGAGGAGGSSVAGAGGAGGAAGGSAAGASGAGGGSAGGGSCVTTLGKAMKFDGTVIDLVTGDLGTDFPGGDVPRTIELWAKFLGSQSWKAEGSMIETGLAVGGNNKVMGIDLSGYSGTTAQFGPYTNGYSDNNNPNGVFVMNTPQMGWLHLSWSYTGNHGKFSFTVNGMEYPIKTMAGDPTLALTQGIVTLGGSQSFGFEGWSGVMDEVKLWSVAKTPAEINANMRVVLKGTEPGLVAYYRFDEGSGTFTDDVTKKASHRLSTCSATNGRCRSANNGSPTWVDSDVPGTFTCAP
ncbi:MAG: LamG-like jellyroll fold domain-containing protein [Myxococcales bacterium]